MEQLTCSGLEAAFTTPRSTKSGWADSRSEAWLGGVAGVNLTVAVRTQGRPNLSNFERVIDEVHERTDRGSRKDFLIWLLGGGKGGKMPVCLK